MIEDKKKTLLKNTLITALGKFCTQFISFLLVPIYTKYLVTSDYGYIDLVQSYISLITPILIIRFDSAIFRFLIDERKNEDNKGKIIKSTFIMLILQIIFFAVVALLINKYIDIKYMRFIIINTISLAISTIMLQLTRGNGDNVGYSIASIICGVVTVIMNSILIINYRWGAESILLSSSIGNLLATTFLLIRNKTYKYIIYGKYDIKYIKAMIKYSLPMIPDGLSWWIVNVSDRTIISIMIGASMNGIYAIATKFANVLQGMFGVFNMTWQESASMHINDSDKDEFFSEVFNNILKILTSISLLIMAFMPIIFIVMVGKNYNSAYKYIPILLLGNIFNTLSNIFGGIYIAKKETKEAAKTTTLCAIINIIVNLIFIKKIGLWAAALSTLIAYIVLFIYRYINTKKYVIFLMDKKLIKQIVIVYIICTLFYYINNIIIIMLNILITFIFIIKMNKDKIINLVKNRRIKK